MAKMDVTRKALFAGKGKQVVNAAQEQQNSKMSQAQENRRAAMQRRLGKRGNDWEKTSNR